MCYMQSLQDPQTISIIIFSIVAIIIVAWLTRIEMRLKRILRGKSHDLEQSLARISQELDELNSHSHKTDSDIEKIFSKLAKTISRFHVLRYNPFKGTGAGGNQSFVATFLNEHGDGLIVSSLYSRDRVSVFSKAIKAYHSDFELTNEEKEAIEKARTQNS